MNQDPNEDALSESDAEKWSEVEEGIELLQIGEREEAVNELLKVATAHPANEYAHFFLGNAYYERETYPQALKCFVTTLSIAPKHLGAMIGAGQSLRMLGEHEKALRMGRQVLGLRKDDPDALFLVGAVHFQRGEEHAAKLHLERFLHTNPEIEIALEVEGMLQMLRKNEDPKS